VELHGQQPVKAEPEQGFMANAMAEVEAHLSLV
jgi:hypothetical protein